MNNRDQSVANVIQTTEGNEVDSLLNLPKLIDLILFIARICFQ